MPKPNDDLQDLKRRLSLLARLEGRPLACAEGVALFLPVRVREARPLARALEQGPPPLAVVEAALELASPPVLLTPQLLAAARRDLRALAPKYVRARALEAPRIFRRYGDLDDAWLARRGAALDVLAEAMRLAGLDHGSGARVLQVVDVAHGEGAAESLSLALAALGKRRAQAERSLSTLALAFDPRPRDGSPLSLSRGDLEVAGERLGAVLRAFGGLALRVDEALALFGLKLGKQAQAVAKLVAAGLPVAKVRRLVELKLVDDLVRIDVADVASAYADWAGALVPHYRALGLDAPLTPEIFERIRKAARKEDLAVLAVCLMKHHARADAGTAAEALSRLDATLGLFTRRPAEAAAILADLSGTTPGAGREALPDVAAWLGDDALLDRYVHLCRLAEAPVELSRTLRADLERGQRLDRERDHLASLPSLSDAQRERLRRLESGEVEIPDPGKTRRRLAERLFELTARAYTLRLDAVFRRILKEAWSISLPRLTPAWRDAIRFYLALEKNRELLGTVLRSAAAGVDLARTLPRNRAWIEEVRDRLDVDAWLAPRARDVEVAGKPHRIAVERDPVEVLRMGIPFDTCLSIEGGVNAGSTVVNAADANKHVIYLRDGQGDIVARKLVAVSEERALIGYQLYVAAQDHEEAIGAIFRAFCVDLATAARLPMRESGQPRHINPGFWYDDGTVPFEAAAEEAGAPVAAYCRSLGLPPPPASDRMLRRRARVFGALRSQRVEDLSAALLEEYFGGGVVVHAVEWLADRMDRDAIEALARRSRVVSVGLTQRAARAGLGAAMELAGRLADWPSAQEIEGLIHRVPRTAEVANALVSAALAARRRIEQTDGHTLDHVTLHAISFFVRAIPVAASLTLCDRLEPLFRWILEKDAGCQGCVDQAVYEIRESLEIAHASAPDPEAVIRCLGSARSSRLAARAALRLAARHALTGEGPPLPSPCPQPIRASLPASRALAKLRGRAPDLDKDPDMVAAVARQRGDAPRDEGPDRGPLRAALEELVGGKALSKAAIELLCGSDLSWRFLHRVAEFLVTRGTLGEAERAFVARVLAQHSPALLPGVVPDLAGAFFSVEGVRRELLQALTKLEDHEQEAAIIAAEAAIRRRGGDPTALVEGWLAYLGTKKESTCIDDPDRFRRLVRALLREGTASAVMDFYQGRSIPEDMAVFLEELKNSAHLGTPALRSALSSREKWLKDPDNAMAAFWLLEVAPV